MPSSTDSERFNRITGQREKGRAAVWSGRVLSALAILFLLFDAFGKIAMPAPVMEAFLRLGIATRLSSAIAALLILSTLLYAIPWTSILGAVLITGYLGGAVAIHLRAGSTLFETVFPILFGAIVWAGLLLRDRRLRMLFPFRLNF
jgi:DoxX-like family